MGVSRVLGQQQGLEGATSTHNRRDHRQRQFNTVEILTVENPAFNRRPGIYLIFCGFYPKLMRQRHARAEQ